jgi:protein-tyrosine kinase
MSIIEQAAKRLEELQRAGIDLTTAANSRREAIAAEPAEVAPSRRTEPRLERASVLAEAPRARLTTPLPEHRPQVQSRQVEIDLARVAAAGMVTPDAPRSHIAEEFRVIKRPLLANASRSGATAIHRGNLIVVTSALPGEGKTFTAVNLAMSIALEMDRTVLLVDADVAKPSIPKTLGFPAGKGLLDVLVEGDVDFPDVLVRTNVEKLSVLPAGTQHPRATEILASEGMSRLLDEMAERYADRIIIFDSPPLLVTTEARVLAAQMGQVVMVVQAQQTTHADVTQALATIEACPVKLMVLNKGRVLKQPGHNHAHGYGYGYGYGS